MNRGLTVTHSLALLIENRSLTRTENFKAQVLGWCVEWVSNIASFNTISLSIYYLYIHQPLSIHFCCYYNSYKLSSWSLMILWINLLPVEDHLAGTDNPTYV